MATPGSWHWNKRYSNEGIEATKLADISSISPIYFSSIVQRARLEQSF